MQKLMLISSYFVVVCTGLFIVQGECPPNEVYLLCGSACIFDCENPRGPATCTEGCVEGCFCKVGYLRNEAGSCVEADQCYGDVTVCNGPNEEFLPCNSGCSRSCQKPTLEVCGVACSMGCFCKNGYFRHEATKQCVTIDKCNSAACTKENEVFDECSAACQPSCEDYNPTCNQSCVSGCICAPGYFRDKNGNCVMATECLKPKKVNPTEKPARHDLDEYIAAVNKLITN